VNHVLRDEPELVNSDPYGAGWMIRLVLTDREQVSRLLDADGYRAFVAQQRT